MKSFCCHILLLSLPFSGWGQQVLFEQSLQTAFEKAKIQHKPVFIEYYNSDCPICKKLEPVFSDPELSGFYNGHFICYKLNTENMKREDSLFISHAGLSFTSVPYFLFFDSDGKFIHYSGTKNDVAYLVNAGNTALDPKERTAGLYTKYQSGDRSVKTLYAYSNLLQLYKNDSLRNIIADELFHAFPKNELGTEKSLTITKNCVNSIENGFFRYWIGHAEEAKAIENNGKNSHPANVLGDILMKAVNAKERNAWNLAKIDSVKTMIMITGASKDPDAFFWEQESGLLKGEGRTADALRLFNERIAKDSGRISASVYTINFYLNLFNDPASLARIRTVIDKLGEKAASKEEKSELLYTRILYYKKAGETATAKQLGRQASLYYKNNRIDPERLNRLLSELK